MPSTAAALATLDVGGRAYRYFSIPAAERAGFGDLGSLPVSLKVLFENLLRCRHHGKAVEEDELTALGRWTAARRSEQAVSYHPARIVMPDSSGMPLLADLAAMRDAMAEFGADPKLVNPVCQVDVVVDHSGIVDVSGRADAFEANLDIEYERNAERYAFLRWAQSAFARLRVVPPGTGIIHQVNIEFLADVVRADVHEGGSFAYPDTVLGMDSHTPMVNGLGVLGWGVGGIEAAASMLGEPTSLRIPEVVGVRLLGALRPGVTATDLVLTATERLRALGVVGKFVEYCGPGLAGLPMAARCTLANMAPEYGATVGFFPIDDETLAYLRQTGRSEDHVRLVEAYAKAQGLWRTELEPVFTTVLTIDLDEVETSLAGPRRPQDRVPLGRVAASVAAAVDGLPGLQASGRVPVAGETYSLGHGDVVIASITSCTNTSNPSVILAAALLARNATARGLLTKPWVKTSFSPGSRVVADYLGKAGLQDGLDALGFQVVGYGCMTCMGNSGPLPEPIEAAIEENGLHVAAVLSGNRNFESRVHARCRLNYLASPPLVIAYALAGTMLHDFASEPLGTDRDGRPVLLEDIWPSDAEITAVASEAIAPELYRGRYASVFEGDARWRNLPSPVGDTFAWPDVSSYIRRPPYFSELSRSAEPPRSVRGARVLAILGDSVTTDHISPIGVIAKGSAAAGYLEASGVSPRDFNSFGSRRMNHDVMIRGTFGNLRLRNAMAGGREGGFTRHEPSGQVMSIFEAAMRYRQEGVPLVVVAGRDYGTGSSRDWAAKGTQLLGVKAILAESFERIHRSNLVGMGVLPLEFPADVTPGSLALDGTERIDLDIPNELACRARIPCRIHRRDGSRHQLDLICRIETSYELDYVRHGGILPYMLRQMLDAAAA